MIWTSLMALLIFGVMLMGVLLIPLLHAAGTYEEHEAIPTEERKYALLFDVDKGSD